METGDQQLELKNWSLKEEVVALKAEKEELQYIPVAHRSTCTLQVKVEMASEEESPGILGALSNEGPAQSQHSGLGLVMIVIWTGFNMNQLFPFSAVIV